MTLEDVLGQQIVVLKPASYPRIMHTTSKQKVKSQDVMVRGSTALHACKVALLFVFVAASNFAAPHPSMSPNC